MRHISKHELKGRTVVTVPLETKDENGGDNAVEQALATLSATMESKIAELRTEVKSATERADDLETRLARPAIGARAEETAETKAFNVYLRRGNVSADEIKALTVSTDANGGFLVPETFVAELLRNVVQFSPVRQYARVMQVAGADVKMPKRTGTMTAAWVSETGARSATQPTYGEVVLTPFEAACYVDVSNQLIEDSALNIESELAFDAAEEFGRLESAAFVSGDGTGKPKGILAEATIPTVATGNASTLGTAPADKLIDMFYSLAPAYRANATWGMNSTLLASVRKLKDSQGNFLWQAGLAANQPETILGRPVAELPDMPDVAASALPIVLGDFAQGYRIADRVQLSVLRDPYSLATTGQTRFHFRRRVGGGVVKAEAFRLLRVAAS